MLDYIIARSIIAQLGSPRGAASASRQCRHGPFRSLAWRQFRPQERKTKSGLPRSAGVW